MIKQYIFTILVTLFFTQKEFAQSTGTFTDSRDGQTYQTISFKKALTGTTFTWMAQNLNYKIVGTYAYNDTTSNKKELGFLYTWEAALKACPTGWHLPTDEEWSVLVSEFGGADKAGEALKSVIGWRENGNGTNSSGFNALPGGLLRPDGNGIVLVGSLGFWWSSSPTDVERNVWEWNMHYGKSLKSKVFRFPADVTGGLSVRCVLNPPTDTIKSESKGVITSYGPNTSVRTIWQDKKGNIWLASNEGIIRFDGKSFTNITSNLFPDRFFSVLEDRKGNFWFGNYGSGVYYYDGSTLQHFTTKGGLVNNRIACICEDKNGNIWFGADGGVSRYDGKSFRNYIMKGDTMLEDGTGKSFSDLTSGSNTVHRIIEDKTGKIWFGADGNTFRFDGKSFTIIRDNEGNAFNNVWSIMEDKKGNIWLGGNKGVWRYDGNSFTQFTNNFVGYIYEGKKGNIWTTGRNANGIWALSRYDKKSSSYKKPTLIEITQSRNLVGILEAKDGSIWFGSSDGVYRYDGNTIKRL